MQFVLFYVRLLSLSIKILHLCWDASILLHLSVVYSFSLLNFILLYEFNLFIDSPIDEDLRCFQFLAIKTKATWTSLYNLSFCGCRFHFSWVPGRGLLGQNVMKCLQTFLQSTVSFYTFAINIWKFHLFCFLMKFWCCQSFQF